MERPAKRDCVVLVVEDDEDTRAALREALEDAGYAVREAPKVATLGR